MRAVIEEQLAPAERIEIEALQVHRAGLVHDDRVGIGEPRNLVGDPLGDQRCVVPFRIVDHLRAQHLLPLGDAAYFRGAFGELLLQRRRQQLLDRRDQVVETKPDVCHQRDVGQHDVAHAVVVDAHVDELRPARDDRRRAVVLELVADIDDDVGVGGPGQRPQRAGRHEADELRMAFREVGVDLAHLRYRHAEQLGKFHGFRFGLGVVHLVADDEQRQARLDQHFRGALDVVRIGPHMHARIDQALVDDLGANALVVIVGVPGNVGWPKGRRP